MAKLVRDSNGEAPRSTRPEPKKIIPDGEWYEINAVDVRMGGSDVAAMGAGDDAGGFGTDSAISRGRGGAEGRALQKWAPDVDDSHLMHLEESVTDTQRGWDQFALNEKKFGVRTDYREELYTTALDPNKSKISMAEAERLAAEIERGNKSNTTNIHLLEERGIEIDDGDMDEEDRYGAVIREVPAVGGVKRPTPPPPPARPAGAWGRGAPGGSGAPAATSAPISIDPRKEANKVRAHMTGSSSGAKAGSPYGTPKQLASPLVGDAQKLAALNLNPGMPHVDEATRRDFEAFKAAQQQRGGGSAAGSLNVSEMKQFSEAVGSKLQKTVSGEKSGAVATAAAAAAATAATPAEGEAPKTSSFSGLNPNAKNLHLLSLPRELQWVLDQQQRELLLLLQQQHQQQQQHHRHQVSVLVVLRITLIAVIVGPSLVGQHRLIITSSVNEMMVLLATPVAVVGMTTADKVLQEVKTKAGSTEDLITCSKAGILEMAAATHRHLLPATLAPLLQEVCI
jgi:LsmAD domain